MQTMVYVAVALPKSHEGVKSANGLILVRIYQFEARFDHEGNGDSVDVSEPKVARFLVNPRDSTGNLVGDVMFLDEFDILVVGTLDSNLLKGEIAN
jgi:hypothetical protein